MKKKLIIIIISILLLSSCIIFYFFNQKDNNQSPTPVNETDYNLKLIKTVNNNNDKSNYLISPYSIEVALNMLREGANGNTLTEISNVIGNRTINDVIIKDHIGVANALFIKNEYKQYVLNNFMNTMTNKYNSEVLYDEFKTPNVINEWVNNKTNGMIDKILDRIDPDFVLGLANALAIDVEWPSSFECNKTTKDSFTKVDNKKMDTEMMHKSYDDSNAKYLKDDLAEGIILPYIKYNKKTGEIDENGNGLEFIAILPKTDINTYINSLKEDTISNLIATTRESSEELEINLGLPRFKYDYQIEDFIDILKQMGIKDAFSQSTADFSNMMSDSPLYENIYVGEAIHKTHIDLNEKGTKAAAVTYFGMFKNSALIETKEKEIINITFDKPFIYMIRDEKTKEMLFFGVVYEPNKWTGSTCENEQ